MTHAGVIIGQNGKLQVLACSDCGYAHLFPLPNEQVLREYYERVFYEKAKKSWLKESEEDAGWIEASLRIELGMLGLPEKGANAFLDVGAGFGQCLQYAQELGWNAAGLEPSPFAGEILAKRGLPYQLGFIEDTLLCSDTADVIRAAWVLEHLLDPGAVLDRFRKALKSSGRLLLTVPNDFTNIQAIAKRASKEKQDWWIHSSHVNYFKLSSLTALLYKHGFVVAQLYATYPMEIFLLQGLDYIENQKLGRRVHESRKRFEMAMHQSERGIADLVHLQQGFARSGMGRDLVVLAEGRRDFKLELPVCDI